MLEEEIIVIEDATEEEIIVEDENVAIDPTIPDYVRNLTEEEVGKLSILDNTGAGDEYLSNDGTYKKMTDITGTSNYQELKNKPSINDVELDGNKTLEELGIQPKGEYLESETDPTVPDYIKNITQEEIEQWNSGGKDIMPLTSNGTPTEPVVLEPSKLYYITTENLGKLYFRSLQEPENVIHNMTIEMRGLLSFNDNGNYLWYYLTIINGAGLYYAQVYNNNSSNVEAKRILFNEIALTANTPTKTSQLTNNSGFITNEVADLINYYDKEYIDNMPTGGSEFIEVTGYSSSNRFNLDTSIYKTGQIFYVKGNTQYFSLNGTNPTYSNGNGLLTQGIYILCYNESYPDGSVTKPIILYKICPYSSDSSTYYSLPEANQIYKQGSSVYHTRYNVSLTNYASLSGVETFTGKKTFNTLPESSISPTTDNQFTNKKYVDDTISTALGNIETDLGGI